MHLRIGAFTSPKAFRHQCGSVYSARPTETKSAEPLARTLSASAGSTSRPATKTGIDTASLIGFEYGARHPLANDGGCMQYFESWGLSLLPPEMSSAATP